MKCVICGDEMVGGLLTGIMKCPTKDVWIPELENKISITHMATFTNKNFEIEFMVLEIIPYVISIDYINQKTTIDERLWEEDKFGNLEEKRLISIDAILDLPWHDCHQVLDKIKMYLVFS